MKHNTEPSSGLRVWHMVGGAVLVLGILTLYRAVPDIVRYMKIRSM
jgi:hypothetical protein